MGTLNDTLTQQLRSIRMERELNIESVADKLDMSPDDYTKVENGELELTLNKVERIAEALEVSVLELFSQAATVIAHNTISAETSPALSAANRHSNTNSNTFYIGVSSEVLEKLLKRIDSLEAELEKSPGQQ